MSYNLGFINDELILKHVTETVRKYSVSFSMNLKEFNKNLVDPIKLTFDSKVYGKSIKDVLTSEILRQIDKSNTNHIGYFHQNIFNHFGDGWSVPKHGYDVVNESKKIFVEIKNKHNTMNSSSSQKTYMRMQNTVLKDPDSVCMLVEIIAKNSHDIILKNSIDGAAVSNKNIRRVSIDKFYELVTGDALAFKKLCEKLPEIISDAIDKIRVTTANNTVLSELESISPNILKSIYLLSFSKYEGFDDLRMKQ